MNTSYTRVVTAKSCYEESRLTALRLEGKFSSSPGLPLHFLKLGRDSFDGSNAVNNAPSYTIMDLFRYSSRGTHQLPATPPPPIFRLITEIMSITTAIPTPMASTSKVISETGDPRCEVKLPKVSDGIHAAGLAIWLFGYLSARHAAPFDWNAVTSWWISSFQFEAELGLVLSFESMIPTLPWARSLSDRDPRVVRIVGLAHLHLI